MAKCLQTLAISHRIRCARKNNNNAVEKRSSAAAVAVIMTMISRRREEEDDNGIYGRDEYEMIMEELSGRSQ